MTDATLIITGWNRTVVFHPDAHALNPRLANIQRLACEYAKRRTEGAPFLKVTDRAVELDPAFTDEEYAVAFTLLTPTETAPSISIVTNNEQYGLQLIGGPKPVEVLPYIGKLLKWEWTEGEDYVGWHAKSAIVHEGVPVMHRIASPHTGAYLIDKNVLNEGGPKLSVYEFFSEATEVCERIEEEAQK